MKYRALYFSKLLPSPTYDGSNIRKIINEAMMLHLFILHEEQEIEKCLYIGV